MKIIENADQNKKNEFLYTRKFFVKDLLNISTIINGSAIIKFASFEDFVDNVLVKKYIDLGYVFRAWIPIQSEDELENLLKIDSGTRPPFIIDLKDVNLNMLNMLPVGKGIYLHADLKVISKIKDLYKENFDKCDSFKQFLKATTGKNGGFFTVRIDSKSLDNIAYDVTDPFLTFPYFSNIVLDIDWKSLNDISIGSLDALQYWLTFLNLNNLGSKKEIVINYSDDGEDLVADYYLNVFCPETSKKTFVTGHRLFLEKEESGHCYDMDYYCNKDGNDVPFEEINRLRMPFDTRLEYSNTIPKKMLSMISLYQNKECTGHYDVVPMVTRLFYKSLYGDNC